MTPVEALERVVHCLDRAHETGFKTRAFVRALEVVRSTPPEELVARSEAGTLTDLDGIGDSTARLITEALQGDTSYVDKIEAETGVKLTDDGARYRAALKGDCHLHSLWSDGGATIEAMACTARGLGHDYMVLTDHSPRLTVARGLSADRLRERAGARDAVVQHLLRELGPLHQRVDRGVEALVREAAQLALDVDVDLVEALDLLGRLDLTAEHVVARHLDRDDLVVGEPRREDPVGDRAALDVGELELVVGLTDADGDVAAPVAADQRRGRAQVAVLVEPDVLLAAAGELVVDRIDARVAIREEALEHDLPAGGELGAQLRAVELGLVRHRLGGVHGAGGAGGDKHEGSQEVT